MKMKMDTVGMVILFVLGCVLILMMLPSSSVEGVDETLSPLPDEPAAPDAADAANQKINELDARLSALEASVKESKDNIEDGEMKANAAIGNLQMTLPP
jgi:hypothetical protein